MRGTGLTKVGEGSRMRRLNMPVSPPHLVSNSHVPGTEQEMKHTVPAAASFRPARCTRGRSTISIPPSQGCWEEDKN